MIINEVKLAAVLKASPIVPGTSVKGTETPLSIDLPSSYSVKENQESTSRNKPILNAKLDLASMILPSGASPIFAEGVLKLVLLNR